MKNISSILFEPVVYDVIGLIINLVILIILYNLIKKTSGLLKQSFILLLLSMIILLAVRIITLLISLGKLDPFASRPVAVLFLILLLIGLIQINKAINIAGKRRR